MTDQPPEDQVHRDTQENLRSQRAGIREDRRVDTAASSERLRMERREDARPQAALELVRADRLEKSISLQESTRGSSLVGVALMALVLMGLVYLIDYMGDTRTASDNQIKTLQSEVTDVREAAAQVENEFAQFRTDNSDVMANHEKTQRILCHVIRANQLGIPANGDCDGR